jgi:hypothetical protein
MAAPTAAQPTTHLPPAAMPGAVEAANADRLRKEEKKRAKKDKKREKEAALPMKLKMVFKLPTAAPTPTVQQQKQEKKQQKMNLNTRPGDLVIPTLPSTLAPSRSAALPAVAKREKKVKAPKVFAKEAPEPLPFAVPQHAVAEPLPFAIHQHAVEHVAGNLQVGTPEPNYGPPLPSRAVLDEIRNAAPGEPVHRSQLMPKVRDLKRIPMPPGDELFYCCCGGSEKSNHGALWGTMVGCEDCDAWFHYTCVGQLDWDAARDRPDREGNDELAWLCPDCMETRKIGDVIDHPLTSAWIDILKKVVDSMRKVKFGTKIQKGKIDGATLFNKSPDAQYGEVFAASYRLQIPEPMDFTHILLRLEEGGYYPRENNYLCTRAFDRDMKLVFDNCKHSNRGQGEDAMHYHQLAVQFEAEYDKRMEKALAQIRKKDAA